MRREKKGEHLKCEAQPGQRLRKMNKALLEMREKMHLVRHQSCEGRAPWDGAEEGCELVFTGQFRLEHKSEGK